jgi:hypothetical protein
MVEKRYIMYECELPKEVNQCPHYTEDGYCNNENKCSFQKEDVKEVKNQYVRKERWYEQYYKK